MHGLSCDRCGKSLLIDEEVRYELKMQLVAAWDPPEIMPEDLEGDLQAEMRRLIEAASGRSERDLREEVAALRSFDLCP
ncbi:MAG: hypothetical protein ACYTDX_02770, partial [Planctomycetota bacterium]